jgi:hypothetical protein
MFVHVEHQQRRSHHRVVHVVEEAEVQDIEAECGDGRPHVQAAHDVELLQGVAGWLGQGPLPPNELPELTSDAHRDSPESVT